MLRGDGPIKIFSTQWIDNSVVTKASVLIVGQGICILLAGEKVAERAETIGTSGACATSYAGQWNDAVVQSKADELVGGIGSRIPVLSLIVWCAMACDRRGIRRRASDKFSNQAAAKWSQVRENESPVRGWWVLRQVSERLNTYRRARH
jgi:hypothetical protein